MAIANREQTTSELMLSHVKQIRYQQFEVEAHRQSKEAALAARSSGSDEVQVLHQLVTL